MRTDHMPYNGDTYFVIDHVLSETNIQHGVYSNNSEAKSDWSRLHITNIVTINKCFVLLPNPRLLQVLQMRTL